MWCSVVQCACVLAHLGTCPSQYTTTALPSSASSSFLGSGELIVIFCEDLFVNYSFLGNVFDDDHGDALVDERT